VLYHPVRRWLLRITHATGALQSGSLRLYLAYVLVTLIVLLIAAR
jgi:hypothetical protein